jgi:hypothetical protein
VLAWKSLGDEVMQKMLWDNAVRMLFGEPWQAAEEDHRASFALDRAR